MKLFDTAAIRKADEVTAQNQNITSFQLMERAAREVFLWLKKTFPDKETVFHVFCGQGNNGGDGYLIAALLKGDGYITFLNPVYTSGTPSQDNVAASRVAEGKELHPSVEISSFGKGKAVVIDALFGIGLNREPGEEIKAVIDMINNSGAAVVSIDVPSGMFMDKPATTCVRSDYVLTFQFPKPALYMPCYYDVTGEIVIIDIGLDKEYLQHTPSGYFLATPEDAFAMYRKPSRYAHKGTQGHTLIIGGSHGKIGAAILASKAALLSGCGLVTAYIPECGYTAMQSSFPEAMALTSGDRYITHISFDIQPTAIAIGPGLGQSPQTQAAFRDFLMLQQTPLIIDADALNILSYHKDMIPMLPSGSVITPHPKELQRLIGDYGDDFEKLEKVKSFSKEYDLVVVVKNARTMVVYHDMAYINPTGNAALATGGSGDVLTGIIAGLCAQGYGPVNAAVFAVYLHGLAADIGVKETGPHSFTASDILKYLGRAYIDVASFC